MNEAIERSALRARMEIRILVNKAMREVLGMLGCSESEIRFAVRSHAQRRRFEAQRHLKEAA